MSELLTGELENQLFSEFFDAVESIESFSFHAEDSTAISTGKSDSKLRAVEGILRMISNWANPHGVLGDPAMRTLDALRAGLRDQSIVFETKKDLEVFIFALSIYPDVFPQVVEHFVHHGDFMELMYAAIELWNGDTSGSPGSDVLAGIKVKIFRLYSYDIRMMCAQRRRVVPESEVFLPPLEVRINFTGFNERTYITDEEFGWEMDHTYPEYQNESSFQTHLND